MIDSRAFKFLLRLVFSILLFICAPVMLFFSSPFLSGFSYVILCMLIGAYAVSVFASLRFSFSKRLVDDVMMNDYVSKRWKDIPVLAYPFFQIALFSIISGYLWIGFPYLFTGINGQPIPSMAGFSWLEFGIQVTLGAVLFDFMESYRLSITSIQCNGLGLMTFIFLHKLIIGFYFWRFFVSVGSSYFKNNKT